MAGNKQIAKNTFLRLLYCLGNKRLMTRLMIEKPLETWEDYVRMYDDNFYTYSTWDELVKSEEEQTDGLTEIECRMEINNTIFKLPCGWYVQYV